MSGAESGEGQRKEPAAFLTERYSSVRQIYTRIMKIKKKNHVLDLFKLFWEDFYMLISDMNGSDYSLCGRD